MIIHVAHVRMLMLYSALFLSTKLCAQHACRWGPLNVQQVDSRFKLIPIAKRNTSLYYLKQCGEGFYMEMFNSDNARVFSKKINLDSALASARPRTINLAVILFEKEKLNIIASCVDRQKKRKFISVFQLSLTGGIISPPLELASCDKASDIHLAVAPDSAQFAIACFKNNKTRKVVRFRSFDASLKSLDDFEVDFESPNGAHVKTDFVDPIEMDNQGDYFLQVRKLDKTGEQIDADFFVVSALGHRVRRISSRIGNVEMIASAVAPAKTGFQMSGICRPRHAQHRAAENYTLFHAFVDFETATVNTLKIYPCPFFSRKPGRGLEESNLNLATPIAKKDGGMIFLVEPQRWTTKPTWGYFGDIFIANFEPSGTLKYFTKVLKDQVTFLNPYWNACSAIPVYDNATGNLHLIFNDEVANLSKRQGRMLDETPSTPMIVTVDQTGKISKRQLDVRDRNAVIACPPWSRPISGHEVLVAGMEHDGYRIGFITIAAEEYPMPEAEHDKAGRTEDHHATRSTTGGDMLFLGCTNGISLRPAPAITGWLTHDGYHPHFSAVNWDFGFYTVWSSAENLWGAEINVSNSITTNNKTNISTARFGLTRGRLIKNKPNGKVAACLTVGYAFNQMAFPDATLMTISQPPQNFELVSHSAYLTASLKWYLPLGDPPIGKQDFAIGVDIGVHVYFLQGRWGYKTEGDYIIVDGMPHASPVEFYVSIPFPSITQHINRYRR